MLDATWGLEIHEIEGAQLPPTFVLGGTRFQTGQFTKREYNEDVTHSARHFTELQRALMAESVAQLHEAVEGRAIAFYHTFLFTAPDYYIREISKIVNAALSHGNRIEVIGKTPKKLSFKGQFRNTHKGGHFNPRLNRDWARAVMKLLRARDPELLDPG